MQENETTLLDSIEQAIKDLEELLQDIRAGKVTPDDFFKRYLSIKVYTN